MAQGGVQLHHDTSSCSICLELLKEPVTIPCGHSYCRTCISSFWETEEEKDVFSCRQCTETFTPKPALVTNNMLAELLDELEKNSLEDDDTDNCDTGADDVACDFCTKRKTKAFKSCLVCLASYCEEHLWPHHKVTPLKRHKLVDPSNKLQENICSQHDEVMKIFCRTDQQTICILCSMDQHKGHDTISAAAIRTEKQRELRERQTEVQNNIQNKERDVELLEQKVTAIKLSADQTFEDVENIFTELVQLIQKRSFEMLKEVRSKQWEEVGRLRELQEELEEEIRTLKKIDAELQRLSHTEDNILFVNSFTSLPSASAFTHLIISESDPVSPFEEVTAAVSELRDHLQNILMEDWTNICLTVENVDVLLQPAEPTTRAGFLKYSQEITVDPNTAHGLLELSEGNRKVQIAKEYQSRPDHPDRFTVYGQALSTESLTGRCYWEVEWSGTVVRVGVAYKSMSRAGKGHECIFGYNDKSWMLFCTHNKYILWHNKQTSFSGPSCSRIGVYLDHTAGVLSFYSVSETMTLLHRVHTTFTEPLHAGVQICWDDGDSAEFCQL